MPRNIHNDVDKVVTLAAINKWVARGYTQQEIARKLGTSQPAVSKLIKQIRESGTGVFQRLEIETREYVNNRLDEIQEARMEAWEAWERSGEDAVRIVTEKVKPRKDKTKDGEAGTVGGANQKRGKAKANSALEDEQALITIKETITREGRLPDPRYLQVINSLIKAERELLGLDPEKKEQHSITVLNWDDILLRKRDERVAPADEVEQLLSEATDGELT